MGIPRAMRLVTLIVLAAAVIWGGALSASAQGRTTFTPAPTTTPTDVPATPSDTPAPTSTATSTATDTATPAPTRLPPCPLPPGVVPPTAVSIGPTAATATTEGASPVPFAPGYLGIAGESVDSCGVRITEIVPDSPAEAADLQVGDIIVGVDFTAYEGVDSLRRFITSQPVGAALELVIRRDGAELIVPVTLGERPALTPPTLSR